MFLVRKELENPTDHLKKVVSVAVNLEEDAVIHSFASKGNLDIDLRATPAKSSNQCRYF